MKTKNKIILVGNTPPPWGGVSVHIQRMLSILQKESLEYAIINPGCGIDAPPGFRSIKFYWILLNARGTIYHFHTSHSVRNWLFMAFLSLMGKKVIFTLHNSRLTDEISEGRIDKIKLLVLKLCFKRYAHIVCVNQRIADTLDLCGINNSCLSVLPAFINQETIDTSTIPEVTQRFIREHTPVLSAYAWKIYAYKGVDTYGVDMMLELISRLRYDFPRIGIVLSFPNTEQSHELALLKEEIINRGINENYHICEVPIDLTALFQLSDIHIRPNATDGDALAIRESLYVNVPTIASDSVWRPEGTILHRNRDIKDFEDKVRKTLRHPELEKEKLRLIRKPEFGRELLKVYKRILGMTL